MQRLHSLHASRDVEGDTNLLSQRTLWIAEVGTKMSIGITPGSTRSNDIIVLHKHISRLSPASLQIDQERIPFPGAGLTLSHQVTIPQTRIPRLDESVRRVTPRLILLTVLLGRSKLGRRCLTEERFRKRQH